MIPKSKESFLIKHTDKKEKTRLVRKINNKKIKIGYIITKGIVMKQ